MLKLSERDLFRKLNGVLEPLIRKGMGSPVFMPVGTIVIETKGFKSGQTRRTPLMTLRIGPYWLLSTVRGDRSFWVKNLEKQPSVHYFFAGLKRKATATVFTTENASNNQDSLSDTEKLISTALHPYLQAGWAFALLKREK